MLTHPARGQVTAVRFSFLLSTAPLDVARVPASDGVTVFAASNGQGTCTTEADAGNCHSQSSAPPAPPAPAPPAPTTGDVPSCASYPEFLAFSSEVSTACCGDPDANCVGGLEDLQTQHVASAYDCSVALRAIGLSLRVFRLPSTCSASCAVALIPMQTACATFLAAVGMQATVRHCLCLVLPLPRYDSAFPCAHQVDSAVATCPVQAPPPIACSGFAEFTAASQAVSERCCDDQHECVGGLPTACSRDCGK